jgi:D-alanyl-lipoteichoic acid acyltransferase DltB (MBOAT superfamily)
VRFNSLTFWAFLFTVTAVLWLLPKKGRRAWLLGASYLFYGSWHYPYLFLLFGAAAVNWAGARWIAAVDARGRRGAVLIAVNLFVLGLFKYLDFTVDNANVVAGWIGLGPFPLPGWVLPLGVSFYLFECMSYTIDVVRKREKPHGFWDLQLFLAFFPHLIAGPILRVKELIPQIEKLDRIDAARVRKGAGLLVSGLFIKIVLADALAPGVDHAFSRSPAALGSTDVAVMAAAFGLQVYFDFAGYSQIAIGSAHLLGIELVENFNFPYSATSPVEFWNRWHMSLSRWIRDYLFYPLVGKKATLVAMCKAAIVSMTLCGVWHGAGWTFALWGLYHGALIAGYHVLTFHRRSKPKAAGALRIGSIVLTFALVSAGWIFFRSRSAEQALELLARLATPWAHTARALSGMFYLHVAVLVALVWAMPAVDAWRGRFRTAEPSPAFALLEGILAGCAIVLCLIYLRGQTAFIYFQF